MTRRTGTLRERLLGLAESKSGEFTCYDALEAFPGPDVRTMSGTLCALVREGRFVKRMIGRGPGRMNFYRLRKRGERKSVPIQRRSINEAQKTSLCACCPLPECRIGSQRCLIYGKSGPLERGAGRPAVADGGGQDADNAPNARGNPARQEKNNKKGRP